VVSSSSAAAANKAAPLQVNITGHTERADGWWIEPILIWLTLGGFTVYVLWALLQNDNFSWGPYLSPFYSPNLKHYFPAFFAQYPWLSPGVLVLWAPLLFRGTCYYGRRVYYRAAFTPPACAVGPSQTISPLYSGEKSFPFVLMNLHRYFFYLAIVLAVFHWSHFIDALRFPEGWGVGVGSLVMLVDATFLTLYVVSCHSWRHLLGGKLDCFSCSGMNMSRHDAYERQTKLNEYHGVFFWISLIAVWLADVYVRMVAMGVWTDHGYIFGKGWF